MFLELWVEGYGLLAPCQVALLLCMALLKTLYTFVLKLAFDFVAGSVVKIVTCLLGTKIVGRLRIVMKSISCCP